MVKRLIQLAIICIGLYIAYNILLQIIDALRSQDHLSEQAEKVYKLEIENRQLKDRFSQIQSSQFIEEQARNKLNLSKEGETIIIIPEDKLKEVLGASSSVQPVNFPNWLGWWKVFFK